MRAPISTVYKSWRRYLFVDLKERTARMLSAGIACCRIKRSRFYGWSIKRSTVERTPLSGSNGAERNVSSIPCASLITATFYLHCKHICRACNAGLRSFSNKHHVIFSRAHCNIDFLSTALLNYLSYNSLFNLIRHNCIESKCAIGPCLLKIVDQSYLSNYKKCKQCG